MKRSRSAEFPAHGIEPDIHIAVADREEPLLAHRHVLSLFSTCVRDLPRESPGSTFVAWDLKQLVLEGDSRPVTAGVVQSWLDTVYSRVDAARRARRVADLDDARPLLLFADACGTSQVVLDDLQRRLVDNPALSLTVTVGDAGQSEQQEQQLAVKLALRNVVYFCQGDVLGSKEGSNTSWTTVLAVPEFGPHASSFSAAACSALERWLHLAGRLRLVQLCRALVDFIKAQLLPGGLSILLPAFDRIYSRRVLECMPRELLYEAMVRDSLLHRPAAMRLEAKEVEVTFSDQLAATWYAKAAGVKESMTMSVALGLRQKGDGASADLHVVLGGPGADEAVEWLERTMAKVIDEHDA